MIKILYSFSIEKEEMVTKTIESTNEAGEKVTVTKQVKESVPQKFFLAKPSRTLQEEAELYRATKFSDAVKRGILTHDLLSKRLKNDDGLLSETEKTWYSEAYKNLYDTQAQIQKTATKADNEKTEENKKENNELILKLNEIRQSIRNFEINKSSLFELTAENYSKNKLIFWYLMFLSYKSNDKGEPEPLFPGKTIDNKAEKYDEMSELNDPFYNIIIQRFMYYVTLWAVSEVSNPEQFEKLVKEVEEEDKKLIEAAAQNQTPTPAA